MKTYLTENSCYLSNKEVSQDKQYELKTRLEQKNELRKQFKLYDENKLSRKQRSKLNSKYKTSKIDTETILKNYTYIQERLLEKIDIILDPYETLSEKEFSKIYKEVQNSQDDYLIEKYESTNYPDYDYMPNDKTCGTQLSLKQIETIQNNTKSIQKLSNEVQSILKEKYNKADAINFVSVSEIHSLLDELNKELIDISEVFPDECIEEIEKENNQYKISLLKEKLKAKRAGNDSYKDEYEEYDEYDSYIDEDEEYPIYREVIRLNYEYIHTIKWSSQDINAIIIKLKNDFKKLDIDNNTLEEMSKNCKKIYEIAKKNSIY